MLWDYGHYTYFYSFSAGKVFIKTVPALGGLNARTWYKKRFELGQYYYNPYSESIDFKRQNLTSVDIRL